MGTWQLTQEEEWAWLGPAGPGGPWGPVGPCAPCGPGAPCGPAAPALPAGPAGPWAPAGPVGPCGPVGPTAPRVTPNVPVWGVLFLMEIVDEPAANPAGKRAPALWFVNDSTVSVVVAKTTVGARPDGLKLAPLMVIRLFVVFTTALKIIGAVALQEGAAAVNMDAITNDVIRKCLGTWGISSLQISRYVNPLNGPCKGGVAAAGSFLGILSDRQRAGGMQAAIRPATRGRGGSLNRPSMPPSSARARRKRLLSCCGIARGTKNHGRYRLCLAALRQLRTD